MPIVTNEPLQLSYFVADIAGAILEYNRLRWHRSRSGADGTYEAATAAVAASATILGTMQSPHQLNGKTFSFRVGGTTVVNVTFADPDPVTTAQVLVAIAGATATVTATDDGGALRLTTVATGSNSSIEILDGDANPFLGFVEGDGAVGLDADTTLVGGTHEYFYTDNNSSEDFWYKVEFLHTVSGDTTGLGVAFPADQPRRIAKSQTIVGYVRLADMGGLPIECRRITFANAFLPNTVVDQSLRWGIFRHYAEISTDRNGYAEYRFLRGMLVDMVVEGTNFVRRIQIPSTGDTVDLMDPALVAEDEFGIQEPNINYAVRLS